jgi:hypothetical protein
MSAAMVMVDFLTVILRQHRLFVKNNIVNLINIAFENHLLINGGLRTVNISSHQRNNGNGMITDDQQVFVSLFQQK